MNAIFEGLPRLLTLSREEMCTRLVRSKKEGLRHMGVSPDDVCILSDAYGNVPAVLEYKTSKEFSPNKYAAETPVEVDAGSQDYYRRVPAKFRTQLLHEVATLGFRHCLLVMAAPGGPSSTTLIKYSDSLIAEYEDLMQDPSITGVYKWFYDYALSGISDEELVSKIPEEADDDVKRLIGSHVRIIRALYRYQRQLGRAVAPTKLFRIGIVNSYDVGKAATDTFCKMIAEAQKGSTFTLKWRQLATIRFMYFCLLTSINLFSVYKYCNALLARGETGPLTLKSFRTGLRESSGRITDLVSDLAREMCEKPVALGALNAVVIKATQQVTPMKRDEITPVCAKPDEVISYIRERAAKMKRELGHVDFVCGLPLSDDVLSPSTPEERRIKSTYLDRLAPIARSFKAKLPSLLKSKREKRIAYWNGEGRDIRSSKYLLHFMVEIDVNRSECFSCKTLSRSTKECAMCGERVCQSCVSRFHSGEMMPVAATSVASRATVMTTTTTAPSATTTTSTSVSAISSEASKPSGTTLLQRFESVESPVNLVRSMSHASSSSSLSSSSSSSSSPDLRKRAPRRSPERKKSKRS